MKAYFSNCIYKNTQSDEYVDAISHTLLTFNRAKHYAFQTQVLEKRSGESKRTKDESLHLSVKRRFQMNDYYTNSAVQEANSLLKSQSELKKMYLDNTKEQIKSVKKKLKATKSRVTVLRKIKTSFVKNNPKFNKTSKEQKCGSYFVVQFKNRTDLYYNAYDFEHLYLDKEIQKLKSKSGRLQFRQNRLERRVSSLTNRVSSVVFGSKSLFKKQFTIENYQNDHKSWLSDFEQACYSKMTISGRKDAKSGNFVFHYNPYTLQLTFQTIDGKMISIEKVNFPYGQEKINQAVTVDRHYSW